MASPPLHMPWARALAQGFWEAGVRLVVLSPGSRSTPLALAFDEGPFELSVVIDERSAGFFALGAARVSGEPTLLICTSGTAALHYHPALAEADLCNLPLLVLTADRPIELQHLGASQTLDQTKMFGDQVRRFVDLGTPDAAALSVVARVAANGVLASRTPRPGPVHFNARFRKPLEPSADEARGPAVRPPARVFLPLATPSAEMLDELAAAIAHAERPLLVVGPREGSASDVVHAANGLARSTGIATVSEATSGYVDADWLPLDPALAGTRELPDLIVTLAMTPVSAVYAELLERNPQTPLWAIAEHGVYDPQHRASVVCLVNPKLLLEGLIARCQPKESHGAFAEALRSGVQHHDRIANDTLANQPFAEAQALAMVGQWLPMASHVLLGNSLIGRDFERFSRPTGSVTTSHQRGAAGIDGLFAGAAGARAASPAFQPVIVLLGDVAAHHDLGSIALLAEIDAPLVVVVVDNGGGRIFDGLPVAERIEEQRMSRLFRTPSRSLLQGAATAAGVHYEEVGGADTLGSALGKALRSARASLIRVCCDGEAGRVIRRLVRERLAADLEAKAGA